MTALPYFSLFGLAFIAATLLPAQSELALAALAASGRFPLWALLVTATAGNVLGSLVNWGIGHYLHRRRGAKWFPVSPAALEKAEARYRRWGVWSLLLSWVPIIGDPLTVIAGLMRTPLALFLPLVLVAKLGRYLAVLGAVQAWA